MGSADKQTAFCTPTVRICTGPWARTLYGCHRLCTQTGRSRGASYTRCTIPGTLMWVHHPMTNTLVATVFLYTRCTDLYKSLSTYACHKLCKETGMSRGALCTRCTTPKPLTALLQVLVNNLEGMAFSYTRCMDLYGSLKWDALQLL